MMNEVKGEPEAFAIDTEILGDIDAWNLRRHGDWYFFEANLPHSDGVRGYRKHILGQTILADTPGPVIGFLSLGGSRVARSAAKIGAFPYHVVAPGDGVGAAGVAGLEKAEPTDTTEVLDDHPQIALTAKAFLSLKQKRNSGLPLIVTRAEHDESTSVIELRSGIAFENLIVAAMSVTKIAKSLGKRAQVLIVSVDFVLEDVSSDADQWAMEMLALMQRFEKEAYQIGFSTVHFISTMENADFLRIDQQFHLGHFSREISFSWLSANYAFERDRHFRTTEAGMMQKAQLEAVAISKIMGGDEWKCPELLLAEWDEKDNAVRVSASAAEDLVLDENDPFLSGPFAGFAIEGASISRVRVDTKNKREVLISIAKSLPPEAELHYAVNCTGALRDMWIGGTAIHRWALPARLKIGQNPANFHSGGAEYVTTQPETE